MNRKIIYIVVGIIIAVALFYFGVKYGETHSSQMASQFRSQTAGANNAFAGRQGGRAGGTGGNGAGGLIAGQILTKDAQSITISLPAGGSRIVFLSASTSVMKATMGTIDDLKTGGAVTVMGKANSDGSLTAESIQIRPAGTFRGEATSSNQVGR